MAHVIDSFLVALGFETDASGVNEFKEHIDNAKKTVTTFVAAAGVAAAAVGALVFSVAHSIDELGDFADLNQVSVASLQELGHAAQLNGSSMQAVKSSVAGLNSVIGQVLSGVGRGAKMFDKFGLSAKNADGSVKSFDQVLEEVAQRMEGMDRKQAMAMAAKLGIDASLVPMLQSGAQNIEKLREEARAFGVSSADDVAAAGAFADAFDRLQFLAKALTNALATGLMPMVTNVIDTFKDWYMANRGIIQQRLKLALDIITTALGYLWTWVSRLTSGVMSAVKWLTQFKAVTWLAVAAVGALVLIKIGTFWNSLAALVLGASRAMMAFNVSALLVPLAIGAIVVAIGLLIDDFMTWREGGDALIGRFIESWGTFGVLTKAALTVIAGYFAFMAARAVVALGRVALQTVISTAIQVVSWLKVAAATIAATWPMLLVIAAIFAVVAAAYWLRDNWGMVMQWLSNAWRTFKDWLEDLAAQAVARVIGYFAPLILLWREVSNAMQVAFDEAVNYVVDLFDSAKNTVFGFIDAVVGAIAKVGEFLGLSGQSATVGAAVAQVPGYPAPAAPAASAGHGQGTTAPATRAVVGSGAAAAARLGSGQRRFGAVRQSWAPPQAALPGNVFQPVRGVGAAPRSAAPAAAPAQRFTPAGGGGVLGKAATSHYNSHYNNSKTITNSGNTTAHVSVNIQGAADPVRTGKEAARQLASAVRNAQSPVLG